LTPELRPFLASYREGLNSTAPLYQALSFYKVIEGVKTFHSNRVRAARRAGQTPPDDPLVAIVPNSFDDLTREPETVRALLANYGGKTFDEVREAFADTIRNAIAHLTPGRDIRVADYLGDLKACRLATPVLRFVAREILRAEIAALGPPATPSE
jgi:hypothetical protein